jgi:hypothetical protein
LFPELEFVHARGLCLPRDVEPDVAWQRLHALGVTLEGGHPVRRKPRPFPREVPAARAAFGLRSALVRHSRAHLLTTD